MHYRQYIVLFLIIFCIASPSLATDEYTIRVDPVTKDRYFIFKSSRGNVRFNHDLHQSVMKSESCLPCHKTNTPTKEQMQSRFDQRVAHYFCRGCHKEKGQGAVECYECHRENS